MTTRATAGSPGVIVYELARLNLRAAQHNRLTQADLTPDTWGPLTWDHDDTERRVVVNLGYVRGWSPGVVEQIARCLAEAQVTVVQVESSGRGGMRHVFAQALSDALDEARRVIA